MMAHGAQKLFGFADGPGLTGVAGMVGAMGFNPPMLWAILLSCTEFFGGIFILLGFATRFAAGAIFCTMIVAILKVHSGAFFSQANGMEYPLTLALISLALIIGGAGTPSVDWIISQTIKKSNNN